MELLMLDDHLLTDIVIIGISCAVKDNNIFRIMVIFFFKTPEIITSLIYYLPLSIYFYYLFKKKENN